MRTTLFAATALAAVVLSGCSGTEAQPAGTADTGATSPVVSTPTPVVTETSAAAEPVETEQPAAALPEVCSEYGDGYDPLNADMLDGGDIGLAATTVELPDTVALIGTQTVYTIDDESMFDVVIRLCGAPLSDMEMFTLGTSFGEALEISPAGESVATLRVSQFVPDGAGSVADGPAIRNDDFQVVLWSAIAHGETAVGVDAPWELRGRDY